MRKFRGSVEELQKLVAITGVDGEWIAQGQQAQYRADSGAIMNFWNSTGTVNFQGPPSAAEALEAAVFPVNARNTRVRNPHPSTSATAVDDAVMQALTSEIIKNRFGPVFDEESAVIAKVAEQCMLDLCERLWVAVRVNRRAIGLRVCPETSGRIAEVSEHEAD